MGLGVPPGPEIPETASMCSAQQLMSHVNDMIKYGLYQSATTLGSFLLSLNQLSHEVDQAACMVMFADALKGAKEFKRAVVYYRKALHLRQLRPLDPSRQARTAAGAMTTSSPSFCPLPLDEPFPTPVPFACGMAPSSPPVVASHSAPLAEITYSDPEAEVAFQIALCHQELQDWQSVVTELDSIPIHLRGPAVYGLLGAMYQRLGHQKLAVCAFKDCLKQHPAAIEAAVGLADLGVSYDEIVRLSPILSTDNLWSRPRPPQAPAAKGAGLRQSPAACGRGLGAALCTEVADNRLHHSHRTQDSGTVSAESSAPFTHVDTSRCPEAASGYSTALERSRPRSAVIDAEQLAPSVMMLHSLTQPDVLVERLTIKGATLATSAIAAASLERRNGARACKRRKVHPLRLSAPASDLAMPQNLSDNRLPPPQPRAVDASPARRCNLLPAAQSPGASPAAPAPSQAENMSTSQANPGDTGSERTCSEHADASASCVYRPVRSICSRKVSEKRLVQLRAQRGMGWCGLLVHGHVHMSNAESADASSAFNKLADLFPNELLSVLGAAAALLASGDQIGACGTFQRSRVLDPLNVQGMDAYACLLLDQGNSGDLRQLSRDVAEIDLALPEVWAVMACFWQQKGNWDKALEFVDRGLRYRHDHHGLRLARGRCLLHQKQPEAALTEFRVVLQTRKDITAFNGSVMACMQARKYKEALLHARTATRLLPHHPSAACLMGLVHLQLPESSQETAEKHLRHALSLDPCHKEAALALVTILQQRTDWCGAALVLQDQIARQPSDAWYVQLGDVYRSAGLTDMAVDAFQAALGLNSFNKAALDMLDAMTCVHNGEQPELSPLEAAWNPTHPPDDGGDTDMEGI